MKHMKHMKHKLSTRLFIYLFAISVVPLIIMAILLGSSYINIVNDYVNDTIHLTSGNIKKTINSIVDEQHNLLKEILGSKDIMDYINDETNNWSSRYMANQGLNNMMISKRSKIEIHIVMKQGSKSLSTSRVPNIYASPNWGVLYDLEQSDENITTYPIKYKTLRGDYTFMGVATKIYNQDQEVIGYIVIDIYRQYLVSQIQEFEDRLKGSFTLIYDENYVVYDNNYRNKEGLRDEDFVKTLEKNNPEGAIEKFSFSDSFNSDFKGVYTAKVNYLTKAQEALKSIMILIIFISLIISILLSLGISRHITKPIYKLKEAMESVGRGDLEIKVKLNRHDELNILEKEFNKLVSEFKELIQNKMLEESLTKTAQISALQAQINPHFLYNTLGTVKAMAKVGEHENIPSMIMHLTSILRRSIDFKDEKITLGEEIDLIKSYIKIQNYRFDNKYVLELQIPEELNQLELLPLTLQPIIENAIIHGLEKKEGQGLISIRAWTEQEMLYIKISDNGLGISKEALEDFTTRIKNDETSKDSIGLLNIKKRLQLSYGEDSKLKIYPRNPVGTTVILKINRNSAVL